MPLFMLAGGELVLLFLGARIGWWILRTRERGPLAGRGGAPAGGGTGVATLRGRPSSVSLASARGEDSGIVRKAA